MSALWKEAAALPNSSLLPQNGVPPRLLLALRSLPADHTIPHASGGRQLDFMLRIIDLRW